MYKRQALLKALYLATFEATKKWTSTIRNWAQVYGELSIPHILAYEGNGHVEWFEGNFEEYEKDKIRRLGEDACNPHAMKYKPLER